ncbi:MULTISPECIES: xanthine phosphoribosyltransferase [Paraclostridium]|uniref:xanthine phosphoribosyltransferase n=1 Tax=Paraclostridium TaxID=1849822 RepID=UPI00038CBDCE|nr:MULTISPECIES: xanthine phosphoribosyltransferase [Paraclostridium]MDV8108875.1 xanthine phosphoribosyltransferase [Bacillus sp. BAU-SS-2023]EQK46023.1 xanthine phosphoribosyltransferase [[Clostridium] bifermentans ATCC 19299] [Paraclostridium bifermentans ATCC 19299]MBZ6005032.1 xanthine phosphoribosyltransferase [Paraclostridium bifermentans]MCE9675815.1 xanthine phosphoribosyltransferase [Paraclostridium bifermentans]MCR1875490.1 xanthine phosphoribosyltransferase [Paraclostridium biferme
MEKLKEKILTEGRISGNDILKVDSFLNHQLDVAFLNEIGKEFSKRFEGKKIDKILTIEASGIAIASIASQHFGNVPVVFAKKVESKNLDKDVYESEVYSFTKAKNYTIRVSKRYLNKGENILVLDDFLANGRAAIGLNELVEKAQANLVGVGIVIEKGFQDGAKLLDEKNINLQSLVVLESIENGQIKFK